MRLHLQRIAEYAVYLGLVIALLLALGMIVGNAEELVRQLIDNLIVGVAHLLAG